MKDMRQGVCALCGHNEVIASWPLDFAHSGPVPMAASHEFSKWTGTKATVPLGPLYLCSCKRCGFSQWFVDKPEEMKIGEEYRTRLIRGPGDVGPYR